MDSPPIFETERLLVRRAQATDEDVALFVALWNDGRVMRLVGFPDGLGVTHAQMHTALAKSAARGEEPLDEKLVVVVRASRASAGECKLGALDVDGVSVTDVKLLPAYWGQGYGREIKQGLVDWLFTHTACRVVRATPNRLNVASQRMQEAVGARRVGEGIFRFAPDDDRVTVDVEHYVYELTREDWARRRID